MAAPSARPIRARDWRYPSISRNCRWLSVANFGRAGRDLQCCCRPEPELPQAIAVPQEPVEAGQGVAALDAAGVEQRLDFGQRLDKDTDVLVLIGEAVHPA